MQFSIYTCHSPNHLSGSVVQESTVKGCSRSIRSILQYLSQDQQFQKTVLFPCIPTGSVVLRFSGDGRRTTKKLGSTMTAFSAPLENSDTRSPDKEYCISIYDGE